MRIKRLVKIGRSRGIIVDRAILDLLDWGDDQKIAVTVASDGRGLLLTPEIISEAVTTVKRRKKPQDSSYVVVDLWREICVPHGLSDVRTKAGEDGKNRPVGGQLGRSIAARMKEESAVEWWREFFIRVSKSDFLMGRSADWKASLPWLMKPANLEKVMSGQYDSSQGSKPKKRVIDYEFSQSEWEEPSL